MSAPRANPFAAEQHLLRSPLTPDQCRERLRARVEAARAVRGWVHQDRFSLKKAIRYGNTFQTEAAGQLIPEPRGTRVVIRLGLGRGARRFVVGWLLALVLLYGSLMLVAGAVPAAMDEARPALLSMPVMLAVGFGALYFARALAGDEGRFLLEFLIETLDAERISS